MRKPEFKTRQSLPRAWNLSHCGIFLMNGPGVGMRGKTADKREVPVQLFQTPVQVRFERWRGNRVRMA